MFEFHFFIKAPSLTDWIQAVGSIIGILGAIAAFVTLFRKNKELQQQITLLNGLNSKTFNVIEKLDNQNSILIETMRLNALPNFILTDGIPYGTKGGTQFNLINTGEVAKDVKIDVNDNKFKVSKLSRKSNYGNSDELKFEVYCEGGENRFSKGYLKFKDNLGNHYSQEISVGVDTKINEPILEAVK
jgi:hypothetical protein